MMHTTIPNISNSILLFVCVCQIPNTTIGILAKTDGNTTEKPFHRPICSNNFTAINSITIYANLKKHVQSTKDEKPFFALYNSNGILTNK